MGISPINMVDIVGISMGDLQDPTMEVLTVPYKTIFSGYIWVYHISPYIALT